VVQLGRPAKEIKMAGSIYKLWMMRPTEAMYQLSRQEADQMMAKVAEALAKVGGRELILCGSAWCSEQWPYFGVEEFPDIEAVQRHTQLLEELNWYRYADSITLLGTKYEGS
jgi:hypothetical protein